VFGTSYIIIINVLLRTGITKYSFNNKIIDKILFMFAKQKDGTVLPVAKRGCKKDVFFFFSFLNCVWDDMPPLYSRSHFS
jgi:hypothetical protein